MFLGSRSRSVGNDSGSVWPLAGPAWGRSRACWSRTRLEMLLDRTVGTVLLTRSRSFSREPACHKRTLKPKQKVQPGVSLSVGANPS